MTESLQPERDRRLAFTWLAVSLLIVVLDLWTKHLASESLSL